jgi:hypothetical protein
LAYGEGKHRLPTNLLNCIDRDSRNFFCAFDRNVLVGYADLWQLRKSFYNLLRSGQMTEEQVLYYQIVGEGETPSARWYVGSMITSPELRQSNQVRSAFVFNKMFQSLYDVLLATQYPAKVMGVGSSEFGEKILMRHGFERITAAPTAVDLRPRFEKSLEVLEFALDEED